MSMPLLWLTLALGLQQVTPLAQEDKPPQRRGGQMLVLYEVQDLARAFQWDFDAPELGVSRPAADPERKLPSGEDANVQAGLEPMGASQPTPQEIESTTRAIEQVVRMFVEPPLSGPTETVKAAKSGTLVVNALPDQQEWVEGFLAGLRGFNGMIELQARFYSAPRGVLRDWGIAPSATLETLSDFAALRQRVEADGRFEIVNAPKLVHFPLQEASIYVGEQIAYIKSWRLQIIEPGAKEIADPEVAVIDEGLSIVARTSPLPGERFGLQLEVSRCEVERPIPTRKVRLSATSDQEVEIGEPQVKTARFEATVALADGASAVFVTADTDPEKDLALVVTVRKVAAQQGQREK